MVNVSHGSCESTVRALCQSLNVATVLGNQLTARESSLFLVITLPYGCEYSWKCAVGEMIKIFIWIYILLSLLVIHVLKVDSL